MGKRLPSSHVEIVCIGDELLDGRTCDRNACWFGHRLSRWGLTLHRTTMVHDDLESIRQVLAEVAQRATYVVVSGGLGPTEDDRTREAAAQWARVPLVEEISILDSLEQRYKSRGIPFADTNRRQAMFPKNATILHNEVGTAAGFRLSTATSTVDFGPGVPREFKWFVDQHIRPNLEPHAKDIVVEKSWAFFGLTESHLAQKIEDLQRPELAMHYIPRFPEIRVFVDGQGELAAKALSHLGSDLIERVGSYLVAEDDQTLVGRLGQRFLERGWTLTTAESCTGGLIGQMITSVPGSSAYYLEGFVTYSNSAKVDRLGVRPQTLKRFGAVSSETAAEMAAGAKERAGADVAISVTGIAGPAGGTPVKPVGTVHLGMATPDGLFVRELTLKRWDRNQIRTLAAWSALSSLLWSLEQRLPDHLMRRI